MTILNRAAIAAFLLAASVPMASQAALQPRPQTIAGASQRLHIFGAVSTSTRKAHGLQRLDGSLADIALRYPAMDRGTVLDHLHAINPATHLRLTPPLAVPEVAIDAVSLGDPQLLADALQELGLRQTVIFSNDVGGWLPVDQLAAAAAIANLHHISASMSRVRAGAVTTQGDFVIGSNLVRSQDGLSGSGVKVGVLSDSFNCYGVYANPANGVPTYGYAGYAPNGFVANYQTDINTGDLPNNVQVLQEAPCLYYGAPEQAPFTDEGRAILQIVHDVAPGAGLAFYSPTTQADFAHGIITLAANGAKVIDDDIGFFEEPFFQDGLIAQAVNQVSANGVAYFSSAGNEATNSYENTTPKFPVVSSSAPNSGEQMLNFDATGSTQTTSLSLTIPEIYPGEIVALELQWDQPYATGAPTSGGSANALDLCVSGNLQNQLTDDDGNNLSGTATTTCIGPNLIGSDPTRVIILGNPANASGPTAQENITISIGLASGPLPGRIKFVLADDGAGSTINAFQTNSPTIQGHPNAAGAAAVGAAFYYDTPDCGIAPAQLEKFSSAGGDPILFDTSGNLLATPVTRLKPDFVAPDGVNDTFLGQVLTSNAPASAPVSCQNNKNYPNFFGTSAAAPHAAAVAALMLQANPTATPAQIYSAFRSGALPMGGSSGFNFADGYGFIQATQALALMPSQTAPPTSSGGGSFDLWALLILAIFLLARQSRAMLLARDSRLE